VKIAIRNCQRSLPISHKDIRRAVNFVLARQRIYKDGEITVCFISNNKIQAINQRFSGINKPTDVLAFDLGVLRSGKKEAFADIFISTETAQSNSRIFNTSIKFELYLYIVHGLLHLFGFDDHTRAGRRKMDAESKRILAALEIYAPTKS